MMVKKKNWQSTVTETYYDGTGRRTKKPAILERETRTTGLVTSD